jgi:hypothetical protein
MKENLEKLFRLFFSSISPKISAIFEGLFLCLQRTDGADAGPDYSPIPPPSATLSNLRFFFLMVGFNRA